MRYAGDDDMPWGTVLGVFTIIVLMRQSLVLAFQETETAEDKPQHSKMSQVL